MREEQEKQERKDHFPKKKKKKSEVWLLQMKNEHIKDFISLINQQETQTHVRAGSKGGQAHSHMEPRNWTVNQGKTFFGGGGGRSVKTFLNKTEFPISVSHLPFAKKSNTVQRAQKDS